MFVFAVIQMAARPNRTMAVGVHLIVSFLHFLALSRLAMAEVLGKLDLLGKPFHQRADRGFSHMHSSFAIPFYLDCEYLRTSIHYTLYQGTLTKIATKTPQR